MIELVHQNPDWIAVEKPSGISVHNAEDPENLISKLAKQLSVPTLFPVHRLDKETSGIQILALNPKTAAALATEFQQRAVVKVYQGIVRGILAGETLWNQSLSDKAEGRKNPAGAAKDRVSCETRVRVLRSTDYFSLCEFNLITGRQHQIRKHCGLHNHSLVGDLRYGDPKYNHKMAALYGFERMFLHCLRIELAGVTLNSPLPHEFGRILEPGVRKEP